VERRKNVCAPQSLKGNTCMKMRHFIIATTAALVSHGAIAGGQQQSETTDRTEAQAIQDASTVREAQERLRAAGFAATPEGLKEFQQAQGLAPSGKLDQQTLAALGVGVAAGSGASSEQAPQPGDRPKY
jgi:peptidoglycan hydrolase-like protein with peptidoglycan-binding domain